MNGCEHRRNILCNIDIIDTDDRNIFRYTEVQLFQGMKNTDGCTVIGTENGGKVITCSGQHFHAFVTAFGCLMDIGSVALGKWKIEFGQGFLVAAEAGFLILLTDIADGGMPQGFQIGNRRIDNFTAVTDNLIELEIHWDQAGVDNIFAEIADKRGNPLVVTAENNNTVGGKLGELSGSFRSAKILGSKRVANEIATFNGFQFQSLYDL